MANFCHECGAAVLGLGRFCAECGAKIGGAESDPGAPRSSDAYADRELVGGLGLGVNLPGDPPSETQQRPGVATPEDAEDWLARGVEAFEAEDLPEARSWFTRAAEIGHAGAMSGLGNIALWFDEDPQEAKRWWKRAAAAGRLRAYINLGRVSQ